MVENSGQPGARAERGARSVSGAPPSLLQWLKAFPGNSPFIGVCSVSLIQFLLDYTPNMIYGTCLGTYLVGFLVYWRVACSSLQGVMWTHGHSGLLSGPSQTFCLRLYVLPKNGATQCLITFYFRQNSPARIRGFLFKIRPWNISRRNGESD